MLNTVEIGWLKVLLQEVNVPITSYVLVSQEVGVDGFKAGLDYSTERLLGPVTN